MRGYETLAGRLPDTRHARLPAGRAVERVDAIRDILSGAGLVELVTHGLIGPEDHARAGLRRPVTRTPSGPPTPSPSITRSCAARCCPEHLRVIVDNERQRIPDVQAFEIGTLHAWQEGQPTERDVLGIILAGRERPLAHDRRR